MCLSIKGRNLFQNQCCLNLFGCLSIYPLDYMEILFLLFKTICFIISNYVYVCSSIWVCTHECRHPCRPEAFILLELELQTSTSHLIWMLRINQIQVLCKNSMHSKSLNCLYSPQFYLFDDTHAMYYFLAIISHHQDTEMKEYKASKKTA